MKKYIWLLLLIALCPLKAAQLPDNMYFRAMQDEMHRTQKELRSPGSPRPFFTAYKVIENSTQSFEAQFGTAVITVPHVFTNVTAQVYVYAGTDKKNSSGFRNDAYSYAPEISTAVPQSYEGLRRVLWRLTDSAYVAAANTYEKKEAYNRQKNITDVLPDFTSAPKAAYVGAMVPFPQVNEKAYQDLVNQLSALGKELPYLESFSVLLTRNKRDIYFLDSEGDFYQYSQPSVTVDLFASLRNKEGYKRQFTEQISLPWDQNPDRDALEKKTQAFLDQLAAAYQARKAEPYLGPVLLEPEAAGGFFNQLFIPNANNPRPVPSSFWETDPMAGQFKDKLGMRVVSHLLDVYDRPYVREYEGKMLQGFMPVDDEGVEAQQLQLVQSGKLLALPLSRSVMKGQKHSNGHARMSNWSYPRAMLTNVFVVPKNPLPREQLEQQLLQRCQELGLEYGYIFPRFPSVYDEDQEVAFAWRIYVSDGHKEPVYGLHLPGITTRSLRDILAAGNDAEVSHFSEKNVFVPFSVIVPSLLVDEMEILPTQLKPERKPFVPLP